MAPVEGQVCRFLQRRPSGPPTLCLQAEDVLVHLLEGVPRLLTSQVRLWALATLPPLVREVLLHRVTSSCPGQPHRRQAVVQKLWGLLYSHNMVIVDLPPGLEERSRLVIVEYLGSGHGASSCTPLTSLR